MKILADDQIPGVEESFGKVATLIQKPGNLITQNDLKQIDLLLVRTVTRVDKNLLEGTPVRFVGSATSGIDHLDIDYLQEAGIQWFRAAGANAPAVVNYVQACIVALQQAAKLPAHPKIGIIGVGHVGSRLARICADFASEVYLNDPPRALHETSFSSTSLTKFTELDLISVHTPFNSNGPFPTKHLLAADFFAELNPYCVLINTARGGIIDENALLNLKQTPSLCFDVWENEPSINLEILRRCFIATPHIAGYSLEAKIRATILLYTTFKTRFNWPELANDNLVNDTKPKRIDNENILNYFNPLIETARMKSSLLCGTNTAVEFEQLRKNYPLRYEF